MNQPRLYYLDGVRSFALLLGIVFHASLSFSPLYIGWAVMDISTSSLVTAFFTISHSFRMELFFLIAGFFSHMSLHRNGLKLFLKTRFIRLVIPFIVGWFFMRPLIVSGWIMGASGMRGSVDPVAGLVGGLKSLESLPSGIFTGSHLWFIYYLVLVSVIALLFRTLIKLNPFIYRRAGCICDASVQRLSELPLSLFIFALPTACLLWNMSIWGMDTPDKSLVPHLPVLVVYSGFYFLGWILSRNREQISSFSKLSFMNILVAVTSIIGVLSLSKIQFQPSHPHFDLIHATYVFFYALMMWSLVWITIGSFKKLCDKQNSFIRYIADSSYWLYFVHLPIVVWLQVAFSEFPFHWTLKLILISILTIGSSLLMYDLFVRSTIIGKILNGHRRERVIFS